MSHLNWVFLSTSQMGIILEEIQETQFAQLLTEGQNELVNQHKNNKIHIPPKKDF